MSTVWYYIGMEAKKMSYEISSMLNNFKIDSLHVVKVATGFAYAGKVPTDLMYEEATPSQLENAKMGVPRFKHNAHLFPSKRVFESVESAVAFAKNNGYVVS
jgi:hypothetical protein